MTRVTTVLVFMLVTTGFSVWSLAAAGGQSGNSCEKTKVIIGVFDSRAVAMAHFEKFIKEGGLEKLYNEHNKAKEAGNMEKAGQLEAKGKALQKQLHMQVFGNAPIDDILEKIEKDIPKIAQAAGVDMIVNRWDVVYQKASIKVVDVTNQLVKVFEPDEKTLGKIKSLLEHSPTPVSREKLEKMEHSK